jgi:uncharacterized membrane protein YgcG
MSIQSGAVSSSAVPICKGAYKKLLAAALLTGAGLALAPVALADGSDDQFLSALAAAGIPAHDGIPAVIAHGHDVCDALGAGMSPGAAADELAHHALAEDPSHPFDQYLRTMQAFVRVSTQTFCPGRAGGAAYHHGGRVILAGLKVPAPPPPLPEAPDVNHFAPPPPVQVAPQPKQTPPPAQKPPPPPPEVIPPPSAGSQGGQGNGGTGGGLDGGGTSSGGTQPAPDPSGGHVALLP